MSDLNALYIERNNCGDCYRCVRECVVKAIKFNDNRAEITPRICIDCGDCIGVCPSEVIHLRDDVWLARKIIKDHNIKVASLAPTWITEFGGIDPCRMVEALKLLGFTHVSESSLGAERCMNQEIELLKKRKGLSISSRCVAINDYIRKFRPHLTDAILSVESPMIAHARMIKSWWGDEAKVVHISSCIAAKSEVSHRGGLVDIALTFKELKSWMNEEGIKFDLIPGHEGYTLEPMTPKRGLLYGVLRGGVNAGELQRNGLESYTYIVKSSVSEIDRLLGGITNPLEDDVYLDLMSCHNGCIGSCGSTELKTSLIQKHITLHKALEQRQTIIGDYKLPYVNVKSEALVADPINNKFVAERDTVKALESLGICEEADQINCNGCGYESCRRFAKALSRNLVDKQMCTYYVRREMQNKFVRLLDTLTSGVMVLDENFRVLESNQSMSVMLGSVMEMKHTSGGGLKGENMGSIEPLSELLHSFVSSGVDSFVKDVQVNDRLLNISIYTIDRSRHVLVIARNMFSSQVRNEEIVIRTQKVIRENLNTVSKIASLLGENASRTEAILNSILDSQIDENGCGR